MKDIKERDAVTGEYVKKSEKKKPKKNTVDKETDKKIEGLLRYLNAFLSIYEFICVFCRKNKKTAFLLSVIIFSFLILIRKHLVWVIMFLFKWSIILITLFFSCVEKVVFTFPG